ncbi:MAG: peptide deformylase [Dehalococcoidia bacterium]|nr:peptide deformylase [Dehalococcoidia bacterium]
MTVRPIRYLGDPVLRQPAKRVRQVDDAIRRLIGDMIESMHAAQGVGLAAPQIGVPLRVVVLGMPDEEPFALINPVVVRHSGTRRMEHEGCLSVPGYRGSLTRAERVVVRGLDEQGKERRIRAEGNLLAQALQHEVDHVNGILYVDRLDTRDDLVKLDSTDWANAQPVREPEQLGAGTPATVAERPAGDGGAA